MAMRRGRLLELLVVVGIIVCLISILLPTLNRWRDPYRTSGRQPCASNLRQIGQALLLYSMDHGGLYPATLDELAASQDLTDEVLVCYYTRKRFVFLAPGGVANRTATTTSSPTSRWNATRKARTCCSAAAARRGSRRRRR
jgi:type II secretory pathway pseudopilin PulG